MMMMYCRSSAPTEAATDTAEKTKQLLYMGANSNGHASVKQHDEHACKTIGANGVATNGNHFAQHKESHLLGQLTLDSSGYLTHTSPLRTGNSSTVQVQQVVAVVVECHQCKKSSESWSICGFCESKMCLPCSLTCSRCSGLFCNFCSVVNYETSEDRIFCLNCSG
ncbi:PREDICTED: uncharacterized protein LOC106811540 isoform X2 [Priapulus caudatus]|uniref:Uncharacterized protein LOC106811540 isoform X2 n=1 Tax=Priapulus caudatus TaxID=37621 RepID=A0ABM1EES0_PRICU|nr:PREDICTED: uncharacterized protein LOC106811540 isoform X2 [Priapulus caudatus]